MLTSILNSLFGCSHRRTTFPMSLKGASAQLGAYVTCLDCGKEFAYNWQEMRMEQREMTALPAAHTYRQITATPTAPVLSSPLRLGS